MVINKYLAEAVGTFVLVFVGSMSILAVQGTAGPVMAVVPLGFGLALLAGIYAVGHVSGGHFNPAVTLAMWLDKRTSASDLIGYWVAQVVGGVVAGAVLLLATDRDKVAGTNTYPGAGVGDGTAFMVEFVLTLIFVLVILASTKRAPAVAGIVIPLTLTAVHLAGIPFSGSSVNPARTLGPALVSDVDSSLWIYLVAPLAGAAIAWVFWRMFGAEEAETA